MFDSLPGAFAESGFGAAERPAAAPASRANLPDSVLLCVLDEIDYGVVLIDAQRRIRHANHLARYELGTQRAMRSAGHMLRAGRPEQEEAMAQAVRGAAGGHRSMADFGPPGQALPLAFVPMNRPLEQAPGSDCAILVVCGKRQVCESLTLQFFARSRKLSSGEEAVLQALCAGLKAEGIARQNGVCLSTVRSQISSIRQKTGTSSVRELVNRVSSLPPMVSALRMGALQ